MKYYKIKNSVDSFDNWINKSYIPPELKKTLASASILIIPIEGLRESNKPLFPNTTEEILRYFKSGLPKDTFIDICISDEEYEEFAFYSDYKRLGNYIIKAVAITAFSTVLANFVYDKYIKDDESIPQSVVIDNSDSITINNNISIITGKKYLEPTHITFTVTIVDSVGNSKEIYFEGPANEVDTVLTAIKKYEE